MASTAYARKNSFLRATFPNGIPRVAIDGDATVVSAQVRTEPARRPTSGWQTRSRAETATKLLITAVSIVVGFGVSGCAGANSSDIRSAIVPNATIGQRRFDAAKSLAANLSVTDGPGSNYTAVALTNASDSNWDWRLFGRGSNPALPESKSVGGTISNFSTIGGAIVGSYTSPAILSWSDGSPDLAGSSSAALSWKGAVGAGASITLPADTQTRAAVIYGAAACASAKLTATLSDASAPQIVDTSLAGQYAPVYRYYTVTYAAGSAGQSVKLSVTINSIKSGSGCTGSNQMVVLQAVTSTIVPSVVPTPVPIPVVSPGSFFIGGMDGETCVPKSGALAGTAQWLPTEDLCIKAAPGAGQGVISISPGVKYKGIPSLDGSIDTQEENVQRLAGQTYSVTIVNNDKGGFGGPITFKMGSYSPTALLAAEATPGPAPHKMYYGAFARSGAPPYGIVTSNGSIDPNKASNLLAAGVQMGRVPMASFFDDLTGVSANGGNLGVNFSHDDPAIAWMLANNIVPYIDLEAGPKQYGPLGSQTTQNLYHNPTEFGTWCGAVAKHLASTFPTIGVSVPAFFGTPINEYNNGAWDASQSDNPALYGATADGPALYMKSCYAALKAVFPASKVYAGEFAMEPPGSSTDILAETARWYTGSAACHVGTCYDGISLHMAPYGDPSQTGFTKCYETNAGWTYACIPALQAIATAYGDTAPHVAITEADIGSVPNSNASAGDEYGQAWYASKMFAAAARNPSIDALFWPNIDEDALYAGSVFFGTSLVDTSSAPRRKHAFYTYCAFAKYPTPCPDLAG